jgi:hypothetical protein
MTRQEAISLIESANRAADLFAAAVSAGDAARAYRRLSRLTHPDTGPPDPAASSAFAKLARLWRQHLGERRRVAQGDIANLYETPDGLLKLCRDPADNDLLDSESRALTLLRTRGDKRFLSYVPQLLATQRQRDPRTGVTRRANLLGRLDGFRSLAEVHGAHPAGLDPRDVAWMWRRLLVALGFAHRSGVIHGAVLPEHVLIHPAEHGLVLVDWCYSASGAGAIVPAIVHRYLDWYPPEVLDRQAPGPATDICLATRSMTYLMAGPPRWLAAFARGCTLPNPAHRPDDAWRLLGELDELLGRRYGPRTFRPFTMPA